MKGESPAPRVAEGDAIPASSAVIEVHVVELRQLFNSIDPSPFRERDLAPAAEAFIVDWSREMAADAPLALLVHLAGACGACSTGGASASSSGSRCSRGASASPN